LAVRG